MLGSMGSFRRRWIKKPSLAILRNSSSFLVSCGKDQLGLALTCKAGSIALWYYKSDIDGGLVWKP